MITPADWRPGFGHNDLEPVAFALYPEVARHLECLRRHGDARMTGSGACCFVDFDNAQAAEAARLTLPADVRGQVVNGLQAHPLLLLTH